VPGGQTVHRSTIVPLIADRCYRIDVRIAQHAGDAGILFAIGDVIGGMVMWIEDGMLRLLYNGFGEFTEAVPCPIAAGAQTVALEYEALGARRGRGRLIVAGHAGDWAPLGPTLMMGFHEGLDIGLERRSPVNWPLWERHGAFPYAGTIRDLSITSGPFAPDSAFAAASA
jgi:arylsulfatase